MSLIKCNNCGNYISDKAGQCPKCGANGTMKRSDVTEESVLSEKNNETYSTNISSGANAANCETDVQTEVDKGTPIINVATLPAKLRRAFIFIEDEDWDRANKNIESILDEEPENAYAYLGKALIDIKVDSLENLTPENIAALSENRNYKRAKKYADAELRKQMELW